MQFLFTQNILHYPSEFFRVWYKGPNSKRDLPEYAIEGNFVHENDVVSFLNLLVQEGNESGYPYSTQEYRDMFRHTLWMVPGVKEAKALSELLRKHPVFGKFGIANVAGEGDDYEEGHAKDALELVRSTIKNNKYSITLSCGKLTTGVTVKEWTAVLMLSGSYSTAAAQYMQTIFRVQSAGSIDGKQKTDCFVFDFAPDRTLKVLTETVHLSRKPGKSQQKRREAMAEFLNYCPVISISGSKTRKYSVKSMMEQIKQIYAERAVNSGFEDESIYNDELLKLNDIEASKFNALKDIIGSSKAQKKKGEVVVNEQGLTDEQVEHIDDPDVPETPDTSLTPEQEAERLAKQQARAARKKAIDILRGISIRMPLMIYGADVPIDEDIDINNFVKIVDDESWKEFMPYGVTKKIFAEFTKYYDRDVFIAAGKRIRRLAAAADRETPTMRVIQIAEIFRHFKNPDKETVLTPWRVVNMHMSDTIGGWCFFNNKFEDDTQEEKHRLTEPRFVDRGAVTSETFNENGKVLEINSKTGLYPLYVAYSFYRQKLEDTTDDDWNPEECQYFWNETVKNNVYVICKTPMAKSITRRTLCGYSDIESNAHYFDDLVNMLKNKPEQFNKRILRGSYWKKDVRKMKFDAVVGNPPYQDSVSVNNRQGAIYHYFYNAAEKLSDRYTLISPARFLFNSGLTPKEWNKKMLENPHIRVVRFEEDATKIFPNTDIKGGICIIEYDANQDFGAIGEFIPNQNLQKIVTHFTRDTEKNLPSIIFGGRSDLKFTDKFLEAFPQSIKDRINAINKEHEDVEELSPNEEYELKSSTFEVLPYAFTTECPTDRERYYMIMGLISGKRYKRWILKEYMTPRYPKNNNIKKYKVAVPESNGGGKFGETLSTPVVLAPNDSSTPTFITIGSFDTEQEANHLLCYIQTKLVRALLGVLKKTQHNSAPTWAYVPLQDFTDNSDIDWAQSISNIDKQLYTKYKLSSEEIAFIESHVKPMSETA